jgi:hypothetical protein
MPGFGSTEDGQVDRDGPISDFPLVRVRPFKVPRETVRQSVLSRDHHGPRVLFKALERLASGYGSESDRVERDLAIARPQLRAYPGRLGHAFPHEAYVSELTGLRDRLKVGLSSTGRENGGRDGQSVFKLVERIKTLKATNSVECTPHRIARRAESAEEPITVRIRRRYDASPIFVQPVEKEATPGAAETLPPAAAVSSFMKPPMSFRERIAMERQRRAEGPPLS